MAAARGATDADARLRGWINHHDERVPMALLDGSLAAWLAGKEGWRLHLYARAMRDAERDGVCWTPLLDRLSVGGLWPTRKGRVVLGGKVSVVHPVPVTQVLEPLRRWLREQTDGAALAPLAVFRATPVRALIQSRLAVLPAVTQFTGVYPAPLAEPAAGTVRAGPPAIGDETRAPAAIVAIASTPIRAEVPSATAPPASAATPRGEPLPAGPVAPPVVQPTQAPFASQSLPASPASPASPVVLASPAAFGPHGVATTSATNRSDAGPTPAAAPTVEPRLTHEQVSGLMTIAAQATGRTDELQVRPEIRRAIDALIAYKALPSENLYSLYSACRLVKTWVVRIVSHVAATIELWRAALRDNNWIEVREAIVRSAAARRDSVIRLILSRCGSSDVLCALCLDGDMPDVPQIARRVRTANPRGLLDALLVAARTTGLRMTAGDLSPLVHHDDPEVRQQALSLLHLMVRPT